jgi:hypothetical protein
MLSGIEQSAKIGLSPEPPAGDNQGGACPALIELFCDYRESTLLGQITAALMESGYHGARLHAAVEDLRSSQFLRDLIDDYRAHISRVGQEDGA